MIQTIENFWIVDFEELFLIWDVYMVYQIIKQQCMSYSNVFWMIKSNQIQILDIQFITMVSIILKLLLKQITH